jgi:sigma-B regulation protein RsbU (phosphoserine phosphatase)
MAAAMMGLARYTIRTAAMGETRPSRILATLNEAILRQTSDQRFCTACCLRILLGEQGTRVTVSSGGHPLPIVLRADGTLHTAGSPGTLLGVFEDPTLVAEAIDLGPTSAVATRSSASSGWRSSSRRLPAGRPRRSPTPSSTRSSPSVRTNPGTTSRSSS